MTHDLSPELADLTDEQRELLALRLREAKARRGGERLKRLPLSFTQEQLWFLDRAQPGTAVYNVPFALRLCGPLDLAALRAATNAVVTRQDALRAVFVDDEDGPRQVIKSHVDVPLPVVDLCSLPADERAAAADRESTEHGQVSFDLQAGPLLAARLLRLGDEEHLLLVTVHHIVYDAWSGEIFMTELIEYYGQFAGGPAANLPVLSDSFADYARRQREPAMKAKVDGQVAHWRAKLAGSPPTSTPRPDRIRPLVQTHRGGRHVRVLPGALNHAMNQLARESGATLNAVVVAGFSLALQQATGQDDLLFGMPAAGRSRVELEPLIGSFANMLVLRMDLSGAPTVRDLVRRAHRTVGEAYLHQDAPYARVVEEVAPVRDPGINPLFQVLITVAEAGPEERTAAGVRFAPVPVDNQLTDFDLFVTLTRRDDECELVVDYNADLYLAETVEHLVTTLVAVFTDMAANAGEPISSVPALRRDTIAVTATFTADLAVAPLQFWLDFHRAPAAVERVPYGQMIRHLLAGADADVTVGFLRWDDWLRHWDGETEAGVVLDTAMKDLEAAVTAYRRRSAAPLVLVRCPSSPSAQGWAGLFARLDDRLAQLRARTPGLVVEWADDPTGHDPAADDLGHIPYTPEYFASLATLAARHLPVPPMGPEREAYVAACLADAAAVAERVAMRAVSTVDGDAPEVEPVTATEKRLAAIWSDVLAVENISANADFFALGGHSLLATQLLSRLRRELGRGVSMYDLFTHPTVSRLATLLDEGDPGEPADEQIRPAPADARPVVSSIQQRVWATSQIDSEDGRNNTMYAAALRGELDEPALRRAVEEIVRRHAVLRTTFTEERGRPVPVVHEDMAAWCEPIGILDEDEAAEHIEQHGAYRYDLAEGPLLRVRLLRSAPDKHHLLIGMHHIVCDNMSWGIFLDELVTLYDAYSAGLPSPLPRSALQFGDFALHEQNWLNSAEAESRGAYWREKLRGAPVPVELPGDEPDISADAAERELMLFPAAVGQAVRDLARAESVTPFSVLLAVYAVLLYRESGQSDLVTGMTVTGRDRVELDGMIGCFAGLLPLRLDLTGRPPFRRLVRRLHSAVQDAQAHRLPFPQIIDSLRLPRDSSRHPVRCVLNYADLPDDPPAFPGLEVTPVPTEATGAGFDVLFTLDWRDDRLQADFTYATDVFSRDRAAAVVATFGDLLTELVTRPDEPIGEPSRAVAAEPVVRAHAISVASSFPAGKIADTLTFWSDLLGEPVLSVTTAPAGQVLRPLLAPEGPFGTDTDALNVVLLRWDDWLYRTDSTLPETVSVLEQALFDLCAAVSAFRARSDAELVLGVCSQKPDGHAAIHDALTARLRAFSTHHERVHVVDMDEWARRYGVKDTTDFQIAAATMIARRSRARSHPASPALVLDPNEFAAQELTAVVRDQIGHGRDVVFTSRPAAPELAALVTVGAARVGPAPDTGLLLTSRPVDSHLTVITAPAGEGLATFADHMWLLDEPATGSPSPVPPDLLTDIATELATAERIGVAIQAGFRGSGQRSSAAPRTDRERRMAAIWADVLHLADVGIHDDFYELGGNSLLAIAIVFHASEAGIGVTARRLTEQRTIAALALDTDQDTRTDTSHEIVAGEVPLTPAQLWWYETVAPTMTRPALFNHPYYLELRRPIAVEHIAEAVRLLAAHHDSLRLRFRRDENGILWQHHADSADAVPFTTHDLSGMPADEQDRVMESLTAREQLALDLTDGPTCRVVAFETGPGRRSRVLIVAHHLVVDAISRGTLLGDLQSLCARLDRGEAPKLPAKTTAYSTWAQRLSEVDARAELPFWLDQAAGENTTLPPDNPGAVTTMGAWGTLDTTLSVAETSGLHDVTRELRVNIRDLVVWAMADTVAARTGGGECAIATTGHGREDLFDDVDLNRTTGWFQVMYPVLVRLPAGATPAGSVASVAGQLARVPHNGIGHGLLKFAGPDEETRRRLAANPEPRLAINYMGNFGFDEVSQAEELFDVCHAPFGPTEDDTGHWPYDLDVTATVVAGRLRLDVGYGTDVYHHQTAAAFLDEVRTRLLGLLGRAPQHKGPE